MEMSSEQGGAASAGAVGDEASASLLRQVTSTAPNPGTTAVLVPRGSLALLSQHQLGWDGGR